ncbi:MAG: DUF6035 family protein [Pseudomonadota bacterium]
MPDEFLTPLRRRKRPEHTPGTSLAVLNPEIKEVMSVETGDHLKVEAVLGSDFAALVQLRMAVRTAIQNEQALYRCSICGVAVYLCRTKNEQRFYFKHRHEDGNCPAITRGTLSQRELDARRYNGAKESARHIKMKEWVVECLQADGRFTAIEKELRWTGALTSEWRKPDVRAVYNGLPIAFEIQLATTYLNVIAERRQFYMQQKGLLFWIFAIFDSEHRRMTEEDVFYNNNQNAFIVNALTVADSLAKKDFTLECVWAEPVRDGSTSNFHRKSVSFHDLTLDPDTQRVYYFDFDGRRGQFRVEAEMERQLLRDEFEAWWGQIPPFADDRATSWSMFRQRFTRYGIAAPPYISWLPLDDLTGLYSAKNNKPWGQKRRQLVEVAHQVASSHKECLTWFMHAVRKYSRLETMQAEGDPEKWRKKYQMCRHEFVTSPELFQRSTKYGELIEFLFPELCPFPVSPKKGR